MFVPSLSWQNDAFYILMASPKVAFLYLVDVAPDPALGTDSEHIHMSHHDDARNAQEKDAQPLWSLASIHFAASQQLNHVCK
jgi:hypothetical protein